MKFAITVFARIKESDEVKHDTDIRAIPDDASDVMICNLIDVAIEPLAEKALRADRNDIEVLSVSYAFIPSRP